MKYVEEGKANNDGTSIINFQAFSGHMKKKDEKKQYWLERLQVFHGNIGEKKCQKKKC